MNKIDNQLTNELADATEESCVKSCCCAPKSPTVRTSAKVGRNDPCICGNGRKYKKCCGKNV